MAFVPPVPAIESGLEEAEDGTTTPVPGIHRARKLLTKHFNGVEARYRKNLLRKFLLLELDNEDECVDPKRKERSTD
jgi:hypothetical protein